MPPFVSVGLCTAGAQDVSEPGCSGRGQSSQRLKQEMLFINSSLIFAVFSLHFQALSWDLLYSSVRCFQPVNRRSDKYTHRRQSK